MPRIRVAESRDLARLQDIEHAADARFFERFEIDSWGPAADGAARAAMPGFLLIAANPEAGDAVGFVHVLELHGDSHLEQLSVHPAYGRAGIGRSLVAAALSKAASRGFTRMTLRTYAEVPWNAPFYRTCGFVESAPDTPALARLVDVEARLDLERFGRRIQMKAALG